MNQPHTVQPWTRSENGWIAGVCQGIAERFDINPGVLRIFWLISVLFFGFGFLFYFICAFCLPVEGKEEQIEEPKFLGVCYRLAHKLNIDLGLLRILTIVIALGSAGTTLLAYIILHFLIPNQNKASF